MVIIKFAKAGKFIMGNTSGLYDSVVGIKDLASTGDIPTQATVSGVATSNFDAELITQRRINSEFDAQVCVGIQAIQVAPSASIQLPLVANSSGVPNFTVTFSGIGYASGEKRIVDYKWFFNDIETSVSGGQVTDHTFTESGSFLVTFRVMDEDGFFGFDTIRINTFSGIALELPGLETSGTPQEGNTPLVVDFTSSGSGVVGTTIDGYSWNFAHGIVSRRQNQNDITYHVPGRYIVVCTAVDSRNVKVSDTLNIGVNN